MSFFFIKSKNSLDYLVKVFFCIPIIKTPILEESTFVFLFLFFCVKDMPPSLAQSSCNQDFSQTFSFQVSGY